MVLDRHRDRLDWWLVPLAKSARRMDPNTLTWISFACAITAGILYWQSSMEHLWLVVFAWGFTLSNGVLDVLDGKVATMTGRATPKGDYLDHAVDRFADVAFIMGIALSPWARIEVGIVALAFTLLTSYLGTQAQAVGAGRNYGGLLGRADRMMLLMIVPLAHVAIELADVALPWAQWSPSLLDTMLLYFAVVGALTTVQRFVKGLGAFDGEGNVRP